VAAGLPNGDPPYGYRRATAADLPDFSGDAEALLKDLRLHPYIVVPEQAEVVRLAFTLYAAGTHSDTQITADLPWPATVARPQACGSAALSPALWPSDLLLRSSRDTREIGALC
jgi:hypothetical protein